MATWLTAHIKDEDWILLMVVSWLKDPELAALIEGLK